MFTRICITSLIILANSFPVAQAKADILPSLFANTYCEARRAGISHDDAMKVAVYKAYTSSHDAQTIVVQGKSYESDTYMALWKIAERCPNYVK